MNDKVLKYLQEIQEQNLRGLVFANHYISVDDPELDNIIEAFNFISEQELANLNY